MSGLSTHLPILPVLLPLVAGIVLLALRGAPLVLQRAASLVATAALVPLAFALLGTAGEGTQLVYKLGDWDAPFGIVLVADRLAAWMLMATALVALFALLQALAGTDVEGRHFHVLYQLQLFGLNGAFLTGDLFNLFVFFEILLLASYGLLLHGGGRLRVKAGLHFVVINLVGSTLFLFAVGTLYGVAGTLNMADLAVKLARTVPENLALVEAAGLMLFGVFALKAALLPLHLWLPAAYAHTSAPVAALFAIMTKVGAYSILRVYSLMFGAEAGAVANLLADWLMPLALATLVAGTLGAVASTSLRQQIAYLVIASVGTLLAAFALDSAEGIAAGLYYLPHTTLGTAAFFLLAAPIAGARGTLGDRFDSGAAMPGARVLGGLFFVAAIALAGLPPLSGFLGKFMLLRAALGSPWLAWVWAIVLTTSLFAVIALARSGSLLFYRTHSTPEVLSAPRPIEWLPAAGLLLLVLGMVIWAGTLADYSAATAAQLLAPQTYIDAVLGDRP
ncbi:NADH dehydrogenase (quinone) [Thiobacillus denitrificans ATCC 25259]|uniref:NADH dehydrogenase (Quinone) n=1 Tax=Thiobacillus denitrificans (strain ATCC 25259 / T1) TaxID=292415 RepID=Q3SLG3_THIDA|nr:monovalent cation/H+ antiporter subunit D [Thiobacillus denitrificans]AAZ96448.1 NADH dehydrogenase (quinone) [Thiobacillus denitrificans ATCC 25259]